MKKIGLVFFLIFGTLLCDIVAQSTGKPDSLRALVSQTKDSDRKASLFIALSGEYEAKDLKQSFSYAQKSLREAGKKKNPKVLAEAYNNLANVYEYRSHTDSSLIFHRKALHLRLKTGDLTKIGDSYNNIGIAYDKLGDFPKSLEHYFKALRQYEKVKDLEKQAMVFSNIGIVYKAEKEYRKALEYYQRANKIYRNLSSGFGIAVSDGNIGGVLLLLKNYSESIKYSEKSKKAYEKLGYERYAAYPLINIASAQDSLKNYPRAEILYLESAELQKKYENIFEISHALNAYAGVLLKQKKYRESIKPLQAALSYAQKADSPLMETAVRKNMAEAYSQSGNYREAYLQLQAYSLGKDFLFSDEKTKAIAETETRYQTEKKEKDLILARNNLLKKQIEAKRKNLYFTVSLIILGFGIIISLLVYRALQLKNKHLEQEFQLREAISEIDAQNRLQEQRLSISRDLHDNIGAQLTFIISSVEMLRKAFPIDDEKINKRLSNISNFTRDTITELRDTIWAMNTSEISFQEMKLRIMNFVEKARKSAENTLIAFHIDDELENCIFTSVKGMNIYRIIQEAVNNALKYSQAEKISVEVKKRSSSIEVTVTDDGKGFDINETVPGSGLRNMKKRANDLSSEISIDSEIGKGTKVAFII